MANEYISVKQAMEFTDTFYAHDPVARMICRALLDAAPRVEKADRWIPVTERMPPEGYFVPVIVTGRYGNIELDRAVQLAEYCSENGWILEEWPEATEITVSHWFELPELPEEEH